MAITSPLWTCLLVSGLPSAAWVSADKWSEVGQSCPTLCDPMDCSPLGSSVHGIFQAWILEWVAISFSRGSSQQALSQIWETWNICILTGGDIIKWTGGNHEIMANGGLALVTPELPQDPAVQLISSLTSKSPPSFLFPFSTMSLTELVGRALWGSLTCYHLTAALTRASASDPIWNFNLCHRDVFPSLLQISLGEYIQGFLGSYNLS